jgi:hypothetical protein
MNNTQHRYIVRHALLLVLLVVSIPQAMANKSNTTWSTSEADLEGRSILWEATYGYERTDLHPVVHYELMELADKGGKSGKYSHGKNHKRYQNLTPEERDKLHKRREDFKSLPPEERERIQKAREKFHNMSPEERQRIKDKWRSMTPEERQRAYKLRKKGRSD